MALLVVDNARLNDAEVLENRTKTGFGGNTVDKEGTAENFDITRSYREVPLNELG